MDIIINFVDLFMHIDVHLNSIIHTYGVYTYAILFVVIFCETGLVVTPFLPGDSLLFAAGTFAAQGSLNAATICAIICGAAFCGDNVNYWVGRTIGPKIFRRKDVRFLNKKHLDKTHAFYDKHGGKTIIIARFMPIIRTFAPFVAGIGKMVYWQFLSYSVCGSLLWVSAFVLGGYFFGNIPIVKANFTIAIFAIIFISILPGIVEFTRHKIKTS